MSSHLLSVNPEKLKTARGKMRAADVVREVGLPLSRQKLWNWENQPSRVPSDILQQLCSLYRVKLADVVEDPDQIFLRRKSSAA